MVDKRFREIMQSNTGCAVVMAGSGSDREHIRKIVDSLNKYEIHHRVRICSAHKQPEELMRIIERYNEIGGSVAYIAVAGGTDALSGTLSFHALGSVISCPPDEKGLASTLTNPPGSSNAVIPNPKNVGRFIAQMYAGVNPKYKVLLDAEKVNKLVELRTADVEFLEQSGGGQ